MHCPMETPVYLSNASLSRRVTWMYIVLIILHLITTEIIKKPAVADDRYRMISVMNCYCFAFTF